ncbi:MAG: MFS transporter [Clostridia bacterium]|nr:MFS transporter [Clostridia bacterium]
MNKKLSFGTKAGYGFGMIGECLAMNTFYIYFLFFLTDGVGMAAGIAGTVAMIATFWGAFTDLIAGTRSDHSRNPNGRRRPFIFKAAIPLGILTFLMYTDWSAIPMSAKPIYFIVMACGFWLSLSFVDLPYQSLGAEITDDYMEKNQIRSYANILNYAGMILASSGTLTIVAIFSANGNVAGAWSKVGIIFGIITLICYWISVWVTKGKEPENPNLKQAAGEAVQKAEGFFSMLKGSLSIKPFRSILIYTVFGYGGLLLFTTIYIYYLTYILGWDSGKSATIMLVYCFMVMAVSALLGAIKIEKKTVVFVVTIAIGIVSVLGYIFGVNSVMIWIYFFLFAFLVSAYFVQIYSMVYDVCDVDEFKSGGSRAGGIVSIFYFVGKFMGGISMAAVGWILEATGYDAMALEQTPEALNGIAMGSYLIPGIAMIIGALAVLRYPINAKNQTALREAIAKKNAGEEYTTDGFAELL